MRRHRIPFFLVLLALSTAAVLAQTVPTATLSGTITADGSPLPGVTVTVASPSLQGTRTAVSTRRTP